MGFTVKRGSEKGSEKKISRRSLERPLREYNPLGVHPNILAEIITKQFPETVIFVIIW